MSARKSWVDIAKGIAIILMVLGHSSLPSVLQNFIFAFHMPLFFIASGYTTNWEKYAPGAYVLHKCKTLMLPFGIYGIIVFGLLQQIGATDGRHLLACGWEGYALWFVPVLFLSLVLCRVIKLLPARINRVILFIVLPIVGALLSVFHINIPWTINAVPYATFLLALGTEMSKIERWIVNPKVWLLLVHIIICAIISYFWHLSMAWNQITPIVPITIGAVSGTCMIFMVSVMIERKGKYLSSILQAIGRETYLVLAFSQIIIMFINHYMDINPLVKYALLVVALVLLRYIKEGINRILPYRVL
jgi:fucose 4-O-acetylase-like acetyltransferase